MRIEKIKATLLRRQYVAGLAVSLWLVRWTGAEVFEIIADSLRGPMVRVTTALTREQADRAFDMAVIVWQEVAKK
jgi:hypothetical protein